MIRAAEPVADGPVVVADREPGLDQDLRPRRAGLHQPPEQEVRVRGRVPDAELAAVSARRSRGPRGTRAPPPPSGRPQQGRWYSADGLLVRADQGGPALGRAALGGRVALVPEGDTPASGQALDRLDELEVLDLAQEPDRVAALAAAEAVEDLLGRRHAERRRLLRVERTQPDERVVPRLLQGEVAGDELDDVGPFPDRVDVVVPDPAGHRPLTTSRLEQPALGKEELLVDPQSVPVRHAGDVVGDAGRQVSRRPMVLLRHLLRDARGSARTGPDQRDRPCPARARASVPQVDVGRTGSRGARRAPGTRRRTARSRAVRRSAADQVGHQGVDPGRVRRARGPRAARSGSSSGSSTPARTASSTSWFT